MAAETMRLPTHSAVQIYSVRLKVGKSPFPFIAFQRHHTKQLDCASSYQMLFKGPFILEDHQHCIISSDNVAFLEGWILPIGKGLLLQPAQYRLNNPSSATFKIK